jgi:hypothetical protein
MPVHDWTRVQSGTFHAFHTAWIAQLQETLNGGVLPPEFYALAEQFAGDAVQSTVTASSAFYSMRRRTLVIRHASDDRIVALLEIVSQSNKNRQAALATFVNKAVAALQHGYHLLVIDLYPPTRFAPEGIHGAIWAEIDETPYEAPPDQPLTFVAYSADVPPTAYVQPMRVGDLLGEMPLFLTPERYVEVPLETTYAAAWRGMPQRWRRELEP